VANWTVDVKPRANHVDDRVTVKTPLKKPGAYLVTAQMANGNLSRILVWVNDTIIVKKQLDQKSLYFVADAESGTPVANAKVEYFGWRTEQIAPNVNQYRVVTTKFSETTDKDGQIILGQDKMPPNLQWLITATQARGEGQAD